MHTYPPVGGVGENYTRYKFNPPHLTDSQAHNTQNTHHAHLPLKEGAGENARYKLNPPHPPGTQAHHMQGTQHAHLPPNRGGGESYTRSNFNSSEHPIPLCINLFWTPLPLQHKQDTQHAHPPPKGEVGENYTAPPINPHHTCRVPKQICLAVTQEVCLAAHICFADNTTTENTLNCLQDLEEEEKQKGEGSSQKEKKAQATAKAPALQNLEGALKTAIRGKSKGKAARPASTPKQRPKSKPIVQEIDEDEADDEPLSQRKAGLKFGQGVAAYDKAAQEEVLPPGLGLNPQDAGPTMIHNLVPALVPPPAQGTTNLDLSTMDLETQPDPELGGTAVPNSTAQGTDLETQPDLHSPTSRNWIPSLPTAPLVCTASLPQRQSRMGTASSKPTWRET